MTVGTLDLPDSLDPAVPRSAGGRLAAALVHETLVTLGEDGQVLPSLVRTWGTAAGGREWTLVLHDGAHFHDGAEVTAEDAVRSVRRFLKSTSAAAALLAAGLDGGPGFRQGASEDLPGLLAADPRRVVLRYGEARPLPLAPLTSPAAAITSARGAASGPFVPSLYVPGKRLLATPFTSHVRGRPFLDAVQAVAHASPQDLHRERQAERVDVATGEPGVSALAATLLLLFDPSRPPFDRPESRAAVGGVIDGADIVRHLIPGGDPGPALLVPALLPPLGLGTPPARGPLPPTLSLAVDTSIAPLVSQRVFAYLTARGVRVDMRPLPPAAVRQTSAPAAARLLLFCPEVAEPSLALAELMGLGRDVPAAREALEAALREASPDARRVLLHRAEAALRADGVLVPLASVPVSVRPRPGVHGASVDFAGRLSLEDAWVEP